VATMVDVARRAGVAVSTVSYAINGTRPISAETRERIRRAMDELGYHPHAMARALASRRSRIVALLFPSGERGLGATELEFATSAIEAATEQGYNLVLWSSDVHGDDIKRLMSQGLVEGVVVMEVRLDDDRVALLRDEGVPFTMIGRTADLTGISYVDIDFAQTTREGVDHLVDLGHRGIAFVNHSRAVYEGGYGAAVRAADGYAEAMRASDLEPVSVLAADSSEAGREVYADVMAAHPDVTAFVTMNERATVGIMAAVGESGRQVPRDVSVVSLVTSPRVAELTIPPLTCSTAPGAALGRLGVEALLAQLEGEKRPPLQELVPCELVVRGTTAPAPATRRPRRRTPVRRT
jgi:DNA-binding LacI/PurR family transcriptional regulator